MQTRARASTLAILAWRRKNSQREKEREGTRWWLAAGKFNIHNTQFIIIIITTMRIYIICVVFHVLLVDDGALTWLSSNNNNNQSSRQRSLCSNLLRSGMSMRNGIFGTYRSR